MMRKRGTADAVASMPLQAPVLDLDVPVSRGGVRRILALAGLLGALYVEATSHLGTPRWLVAFRHVNPGPGAAGARDRPPLPVRAGSVGSPCCPAVGVCGPRPGGHEEAGHAGVQSTAHPGSVGS
jgi:hypothetical protein